MLILNDGRDKLYQWDSGRTAAVEIDCEEIHFSNIRYGDSLVLLVENGQINIPNQLLINPSPIYCWAFVEDKTGAYTIEEQVLEVIKRAKPTDYVYTETEVQSVEKIVNDVIDEAIAEGKFGKGTTFIPSVNEGVLSWTNDGGLENPPPVDIVAEVIADLPKYSGSYTVTPLIRESKLETQGKVMTDDVIVKSIPYQEVSNISGGKTAVIGQP